jgi:hypothetical protein
MVVADSSKFGRKSLTLVSALDAIDTLVSDDGMSQAWRDVVSRAGATLVIAAVPEQDDRPAALRGATHPERARPA